MATEFKLPQLGEGVDSADVSRILVAEGDTIDADDNVMELETEKAVADLPCPHAGEITKLHVSEGDTVEVGQVLLTIEEIEEEAAEEPSQEEPPAEETEASEPEAREAEEKASAKGEEGRADDKAEAQEKATAEEGEDDEEETEPAEERTGKESREVEAEPTTTTTATAGNGRHEIPPPAGPATRRLARKLNVDLEDFEPPAGQRIVQEDVVRAYLEREQGGAVGAREELPDFSRFGEIERQKLSQIAKTASQRLRKAWQIVPHVTQHGYADITQLEAARRQHNQAAKEESGGDQPPKITLTAIAVKCVAGLLREFPRFNASLDTAAGELILKRHYHIGVAVDTEHGLVVPVVRDADRKSIQHIAAEIVEMAGRARRRQLQQEDLEGGTFSISNQGGIGGGAFTPIVNYPEVAILGLARAANELKMIDGRPQERLVLPLSLSYDHRVINGADAARFMERLTGVLSDCFTLLVEC